MAALTGVLVPAQAVAQQPAAGAKPAGAAKPGALSAAPLRRPVIAPAAPMVAPRTAPAGDSGGVPTGPRTPHAARVSVSARQAAEQTIAALVAAMKNLPKRPPAAPEPRTAPARRAAASRTPVFDAPPRINYHVTWPARPEDPGLDRRVELGWPGGGSGPVALRWNEPTQ